MTISKAQPMSPSDPFSRARAEFEKIVDWLGGAEAPDEHGPLEKAAIGRGTELVRRLMQARFDLLFERERVDFAASRREPGVEVRVRARQLEMQVGRLMLRRHGVTRPGEDQARFPMDERLNLPLDLYSHALRERVVDEARRGAWDEAVEQVGARTAGHVPKRQAEGLAVHVTQDFEAFYEQPCRVANDTLSADALLVASSDSKGIRMRPEALRDATRKAAEAEQREVVRGDPMAQKKLRQHTKRMAIVTAVWEQEPHSRSARDIIDNLRPASDKKARKRKKARKARAPRPQHKRLSASVDKSQGQGIAEMFEEIDRRDPGRTRTVHMLVDGEESQQSAILTEASRRDRKLTLVLDIIHVLSYLWCAAFALCGKNDAEADAWVLRFLLKLLTRPVNEVIADIQRSLARRGLSAKQRKPVDKCIGYFTRNVPWMDYPAFLAAGLPIATGVIEGACRHLVQDRLGITGARWGLAGAEAILKLRALRSSGDWEDYWRFHERREARRNYARAA